MTNYQYTTVPFAGLMFDSFMTEDEQCFVTLSCVANGLNVSRQNLKNWLKRQDNVKGISVMVGKRLNVPATAYPLEVFTNYLNYLANERLDKQAQALLLAVTQADLERTIKEANGIQVTAMQHEETRAAIRHELIKKALKLEQSFRKACLEDKDDLAESLAGEQSPILNELTEAEYEVYDTQVEPIRQAYRRQLTEKICAKNNASIQQAVTFNRAMDNYNSAN